MTTLDTEGTVVKCTKTFDYNGKTVPASRKYTIVKTERVPLDEYEPVIMETKATLEIIADDVSDKVCEKVIVIGDDISEYFTVV